MLRCAALALLAFAFANARAATAPPKSDPRAEVTAAFRHLRDALADCASFDPDLLMSADVRSIGGAASGTPGRWDLERIRRESRKIVAPLSRLVVELPQNTTIDETAAVRAYCAVNAERLTAFLRAVDAGDAHVRGPQALLELRLHGIPSGFAVHFERRGDKWRSGLVADLEAAMPVSHSPLERIINPKVEPEDDMAALLTDVFGADDAFSARIAALVAAVVLETPPPPPPAPPEVDPLESEPLIEPMKMDVQSIANDYVDFTELDDTFLKLRAERGDVGAQRLVGYRLLSSDEAKGIAWLTRAADHDDARSALLLAEQFAPHEPNLREDKRALEWYRRAAELGNVDAMDTLGMYHWTGRGGLKADCAQAIYWYQRAADGGQRFAMNNLAWTLSTCPDSAQRDGERAVALAEQLLASLDDSVIGDAPPVEGVRDTLAAAYCEAGAFDRAIAAQRAVVSGIRAEPDSNYQHRLDLYAKHECWRGMSNGD